MNAVESTPTITGTQTMEWTCSAVWGGKLRNANETFLASPVIWRSSAVWGSRALWMSHILQPCAVERMPAVGTPRAQDPGWTQAWGAR